MTTDVETVIIGAGVVGLACARYLAAAGHEVVILERHGAIGTETSSRNSEVIHAGLYYPKDSLRAMLCVEGRKMLYAFADTHGVDCGRLGKLVVATTPDEVPKLHDIEKRARVNGVDDVKLITSDEARAMEPNLACEAALFSPSTGVINSHALMLAILGEVEQHSGQLALNTEVSGIKKTANGSFKLATHGSDGEHKLTAKNLIIAGGLSATKLGRMLRYENGYDVPKTYPARGHYFTYSGKAPFARLIYPVPQPGSLGIHLTLDCGGQVKFGPDVEWLDPTCLDDSALLDQQYRFDDPDNTRRKKFERAVRHYWPDLPDETLQQGYIGIRPKLYPEGARQPDFTIHTEAEHGLKNLVALYGIESPGLTSSLAIGRYIAGQLARARGGP